MVVGSNITPPKISCEIHCVVLGMALPDQLNKAVTLQIYILRYLVLISALRLDMLTEVSDVPHQCSQTYSRAVYRELQLSSSYLVNHINNYPISNFLCCITFTILTASFNNLLIIFISFYFVNVVQTKTFCKCYNSFICIVFL